MTVRATLPMPEPPAADPPPTTSSPVPGFDEVYRRHFQDCCRWLRAMGAPDTDLDDLAQEAFVTLRRRMAEGHVSEPRRFLYQIAVRTLLYQRRRAWWKNLFHRRGEMAAEAPTPSPGPGEQLEAKERARLAHSLLDRLPVKQRRAVVLFEIEGYTGEEIAALEGIPAKTVWTRLHHGRRALCAMAEVEVARERAAEAARPGARAPGRRGGQGDPR